MTSVIAPALERRICDAIRAGIRPEVAAVYCGIGARTYYRWMQLGRAADAVEPYPGFLPAVSVALAECRSQKPLRTRSVYGAARERSDPPVR